MSAVVDASLVVAALADPGREGTWAEEIVAGGDLVAPHLLPAEATNILRRLERARQIGRLEAAAAHRDLMRLDVTLVGFDPCAERVWQLRDTVSSYDAWYVAVPHPDTRWSRQPPRSTTDQGSGRQWLRWCGWPQVGHLLW